MDLKGKESELEKTLRILAQYETMGPPAERQDELPPSDNQGLPSQQLEDRMRLWWKRLKTLEDRMMLWEYRWKLWEDTTEVGRRKAKRENAIHFRRQLRFQVFVDRVWVAIRRNLCRK